ncbi:MAG TPA: NAD(P)H-hydrate dehydratase [Ignavibacteria bacterium]|nr:NAD(P)H-hydrate dehydratase [Ignavibacteria bacterium]HRF66477.1 NAD(P)H-hydrate dehydratase [Ignavibacteria bacterium]HRJ03633.1 NAD(P)H-hydrate dehydratase [Ignavibacteria bacterium]
MRPAFTFSEIREAEKVIIEKEGIPSLILMENAGKNSFDVISSIYPDLGERTIFIVCGKGNNAGDGYVAARNFLINSIPVEIFNLSGQSELKGDALVNYDILAKLSSKLCIMHTITGGDPDILYSSLNNVKGKALIIDAILGSGIKGSVTGLYEKIIDQINSVKHKNFKIDVVSLDVPSGLGEGNTEGAVIDACHTITMGAIKTDLLFGKGKENSGKVYVVPIGITNDLFERVNTYNKFLIEEYDVKKLIPKRKKTSYKYSNGKTLIIGGSKGLSGAVIMSSLAALKCGSGAVLAAFPHSISAHFSRKLAEVIKTELNETTDGSIAGDSFSSIQKQIDKADAVLIGPGLSLNPETANFLYDVITNSMKPLVIDADALTLLAGNLGILNERKGGSEVILTPHIGEFAKLTGKTPEEINADRFELTKQFAKEFNVNVVLKSETTISCSSDGEIFINDSGNEQLGSAGSGDVLSGIITSLLAQTGNARTAMICGNYIHGKLAEMYFDKYGNKQSASQQDLIKFIPNVITELLN